MNILEALQEYIFNSKASKLNGDSNSAPAGCLHRCDSHSCCCCSPGATSVRDCATSTHDLSAYIWHTEGEGMEEYQGTSSNIRVDEYVVCRCPARTRYGRQQCLDGTCCKTEAQGFCDASTSTFDLNTYIWGTEGIMSTTDTGSHEDMDDRSNASLDEFFTDLGNINNAGGSCGVQRDKKKSRVAAALGFGVSTSSVAAPSRKKKRRRIVSEEEQIFSAWSVQLR